MWVKIGSRRLAVCSRGSWFGGVVLFMVMCVFVLCNRCRFWKSLVTGARVMCFGCLDILVEMVFCHCQYPISTPAFFCNGYSIV